jgi:adenylyltransferase/sulfurtransferase
MLYDALDMTFREMKVRKDPKCPICGTNPTIHELIDYEQFCGVRGEETAPSGSSTSDQGTGEMSPLELDAILRDPAAAKPLILDVRNPEEIDICRIAGSTVIPLPELSERLGELDRSIHIVVHCKSGARSAKAVALMRDAGFERLDNLTGGILAWIRDVDPSLPAY